MRAVLLFGLVVVVSAYTSAFVEVRRGYHEEVGIPLYEQIKAYEEKQAEDETAVFDDRIVGGAIAAVGAYPYFGGLMINFVNIAGQSVCGSSLVSSNRLVTAAHCWFDGINQASLFTVILGSNLLLSGGTRIATNQVIMHPQWNRVDMSNDIAMIYLPTHVVFSATISPIEIPSTSELWNTFTGWWAVAAGFGKTTDLQAGASSVVNHVTIQVISNAQCTAVFGTQFVHDSTICTNGAGGVGICNGDSGGPLVINNNGRFILIGVSSFVANNACQQGHPSAFARVTNLRNFIVQHM